MSENGEKLLTEWATRLGLGGWAIELADEQEPSEMGLEGSDGCTAYEESSKTAYIQIIDPRYYGKKVRPFDYEEILVHELLHLKLSLLWSMEDNDLQSRVVHQIIDDLARAMVDAKNRQEADG